MPDRTGSNLRPNGDENYVSVLLDITAASDTAHQSTLPVLENTTDL